MSARILSLFLPRLASDLVRRRAREVGELLVLVARQGRGEVLACLTPEASAQGLRKGQSLSEARTLLPGLTTRPHDPALPRRALQALRRWALRYAPWVAVDGEDGLVLDLTGSAHLMGGEAALCADMAQRLAAMGIEARLAVAPTRGAAWALARFAPGPVTLADEARAAIAPLPMAALRLDADTVAGLARLGLARIGDLSRTPRAPLTRRFGPDVMLRLDQAQGALREPVAAPPDTAPHAVRLSLPEPIGTTADVMAGLTRLLERLCRRLAREEAGARRLRLELARADGGRAEAEIALARPMRDPAAMAALFERAIEALEAGFGFDALRLSAPGVEALPPAQLGGDGYRGGKPDGAIQVGGSSGRSEELADLMTRLGNRVGLESLIRPLPADSHIPERAFLRASAVFTEAPGAWPYNAERPLVLFPPEPLEAPALPDPPRHLRWRRQALTRLRAFGPERLTPEWWLDDPLWRSGVRDYWRLETVEGPRLWIFFTPQEPGWAVQGEFE
ncbi:DNA polymerase Y family protein [Rhodobacter sp. NTK016B]|uniref:Y-family DNA polymerase n=1 Tax=Rhodobacter sp. NTK016B TaxID=2759676 RepID=UPI001A8C781C|nr:DNA polymerase Y family protein [Rhodobacter sp. NTK016B]MBN8293015.1 DNA polymerase Y family protein [Rhodobacter sp. NTK016B]